LIKFHHDPDPASRKFCRILPPLSGLALLQNRIGGANAYRRPNQSEGDQAAGGHGLAGKFPTDEELQRGTWKREDAEGGE
jgi:hypothetical protein